MCVFESWACKFFRMNKKYSRIPECIREWVWLQQTSSMKPKLGRPSPQRGDCADRGQPSTVWRTQRRPPFWKIEFVLFHNSKHKITHAILYWIKERFCSSRRFRLYTFCCLFLIFKTRNPYQRRASFSNSINLQNWLTVWNWGAYSRGWDRWPSIACPRWRKWSRACP